jgi:hypothetical protein
MKDKGVISIGNPSKCDFGATTCVWLFSKQFGMQHNGHPNFGTIFFYCISRKRGT